ncbi:fibrocystin-L-like [Pecten maximus]|uniref:fibrocystin-L-like n=1 Tax=Pecten maximus TaxID=6579 RepID=UPI001458B2F4|nr:fibrocystin-L-like [Pecten maximus]
MTNYNTITIGAIICNVTEATNTSLTCTSDVLPSGEHEVTVDVFGKGLARYDAQNFTVHSSIQIHDFHPTCSGLGGLSNLTITGYGFEKDSTVKLGEKICVSRTVTSTMIVCQIPSTHFAGNVSITLDHPGKHQVIYPVKFAYNSSTTPRVESVYPTSVGVTGGSIMEIHGSGFNSAAKQITLLIGDTKCNITRHNDSLVVAELPPCYPGRHEIKILIIDAGAALNKDNELPSVECVFEVNGVNPSSGSVYGGTTLTVTGKGFIPTLKVKAGSLDCDVTNSSDNQFICQIGRSQAVHYINNHGIHPNFGKYYYWKPQHVKILVGDVVRWDWDFPFYITTMKPRVEETYNLTTKYGKPGGFSSGDIGSTTGSYSRQFSKAGTFFFWSGFLDSYQTTWFHGSVEVSERVSDIAPISVSIGETEATYIVNETTNTLGNTTSMDTEAVRNGCADAQPVFGHTCQLFRVCFLDMQITGSN